MGGDARDRSALDTDRTGISSEVRYGPTERDRNLRSACIEHRVVAAVGKNSCQWSGLGGQGHGAQGEGADTLLSFGDDGVGDPNRELFHARVWIDLCRRLVGGGRRSRRIVPAWTRSGPN